MTCNANWPEIKRELAVGEEAQNKPDIDARVFRAKAIALKHLIKKKKVFGVVAAMIYAYIKNVVRLHGVPKDIVSDKDSRFLSKFSKSVQQNFGTTLKMSTTFHPATDGQYERTIQTLEDMLRSCVLDYQNGWEDSLDLVEFSYNNSYHASIGMAPFEALYGRKCRSPLCWSDISETIILGPQLIEETTKQQRTRCVSRLSIGKVHPRQAKSHILQPETIEIDQSLTYEERPIRILDSKVRSTRKKDVKIVKVLWSNQETEEATWEAEDEMKKKYPELFEVS
ncbi:uncharacterized protein LOC110697721 [Chenopodium quinoa]|uniref:uncharacterized protein LOC110697721 n=1 Tax=Chenopodium quinoa TaxID=63459 RepID=UPI000B7890C4|nr:uncharacterized protein LOC110697721 [Chenopodium quinoa]